jgi:hypothetical protein
MIHETGYGPGYAIGGINELKEAVSYGILRGVMLIRANADDSLNTIPRKTITLGEIVNLLPTSMQNGTIAWLKLEGENYPTTAIISAGLEIPGLTQLTYARLFNSQTRGQDADAYLSGLRKRPHVEKEILSEPVSIATLLQQSDKEDDN